MTTPRSFFKVGVESLRSVKNIIDRNRVKPLTITRFLYEVTRRCNGRCVYCDIWKTDDFTGELTLDELREGLKPKSLFKKVRTIAVTGGEPFLRPDLVDVCRFLKELCPGGAIGLVTNGLQPEVISTRMNEIREFDPRAHIGVSIDGFRDEDNYQRGSFNHYDRAWKTVYLLKDGGIPVGVGSVVTKLNLNTMHTFECFCEAQGVPHGVMTANVSPHFYGNVDNPKIDALAISEEDVPVLKRLCLRRPTSFRYYFVKYLEGVRIPCFSGFNSFFLSSIGKVYPCIHLDASIGNIKYRPFGDWWSGNPWVKILRDSIVNEDCNCFTACEVGGWFQANILPAVSKRIREVMRLR